MIYLIVFGVWMVTAIVIWHVLLTKHVKVVERDYSGYPVRRAGKVPKGYFFLTIIWPVTFFLILPLILVWLTRVFIKTLGFVGKSANIGGSALVDIYKRSVS